VKGMEVGRGPMAFEWVLYGREYAEAVVGNGNGNGNGSSSSVRMTKGSRDRRPPERMRGLSQVAIIMTEVVCEGESGLDGWKGLTMGLWDGTKLLPDRIGITSTSTSTTPLVTTCN
jgi:hypothetical protein